MYIDIHRPVFHIHSFNSKVSDGANVVAVGKLGDSKDTLVFVGGNCSIYGFDASGQDRFWTVINHIYLIIYIYHFEDIIFAIH